MPDQTEVIAVLLSDADAAEPRSDSAATVLVRNAEGQVSLRSVNPDSAFGRLAMRTGCFRRGKPIFDPVLRQMIGYEMERVPDLLAAAS